jgi:hypothetical protein
VRQLSFSRNEIISKKSSCADFQGPIPKGPTSDARRPLFWLLLSLSRAPLPGGLGRMIGLRTLNSGRSRRRLRRNSSIC